MNKGIGIAIIAGLALWAWSRTKKATASQVAGATASQATPTSVIDAAKQVASVQQNPQDTVGTVTIKHMDGSVEQVQGTVTDVPTIPELTALYQASEAAIATKPDSSEASRIDYLTAREAVIDQIVAATGVPAATATLIATAASNPNLEVVTTSTGYSYLTWK